MWSRFTSCLLKCLQIFPDHVSSIFSVRTEGEPSPNWNLEHIYFVLNLKLRRAADELMSA